MWRNYFPCTRYVDEVPFFDAVGFQQGYPENRLVTDDACLTPLWQHVQSIFIQHTEKNKTYFWYWTFRTSCQFVWRSRFTRNFYQVFDWYKSKYMISRVHEFKIYVLIRNPCMYHNLVCNSSQFSPCRFNLIIHLLMVWCQ